MNRYIEAYLLMRQYPSSYNMQLYIAAAYALCPWDRGEHGPQLKG